MRHAKDHIHVVATLAREDGRAPNTWNDWRHLNAVAHEFGDTFGLRRPPGAMTTPPPPAPG